MLPDEEKTKPKETLKMKELSTNDKDKRTSVNYSPAKINILKNKKKHSKMFKFSRKQKLLRTGAATVFQDIYDSTITNKSDVENIPLYAHLNKYNVRRAKPFPRYGRKLKPVKRVRQEKMSELITEKNFCYDVMRKKIFRSMLNVLLYRD